MIQGTLFLVLLLLVVAAAVGVIAERFSFPSPAVMLLAGAALAFVPGLPHLRATPDIVLLVLLPPLLYYSGVGMSWRGLRAYKRPILLLAVGCVLFTAAAVAAATHYLLHFDWAIGFVLGAIVSPPDSVLLIALTRGLHLPRRLLTILAGESLLNDAAALVILAFALHAAITGTFSLRSALLEFVAICTGEIAYGVVLGWSILHIRRWAGSPRGEVLLALATPFIAFWPAHAIGGSGVIACVTTGLYVSWNGRRFISADTRLQGYFIWDLVDWTTESLVFLVGGLQAADMLEAFRRAGWDHALLVALVAVLTIVVARFVWVFPATYVPHLIPSIRRSEPVPNWRFPFLVSFAGVRGVDTLAAALLVPKVINGQPCPERDVILFSTFCVIGASIFVFGPALSPIIRWLGLDAKGREEAERNGLAERHVRTEALDAVLAFLKRPTGSRPCASEAATRVLQRRRDVIAASADATSEVDAVSELTALTLELVRIERASVMRAYDQNRLTDEARRRIERELDLQEVVMKNQHHNLRRSPRA